MSFLKMISEMDVSWVSEILEECEKVIKSVRTMDKTPYTHIVATSNSMGYLYK